MGAIQLKNVTKKFGDQMVIDDLNLSIEDGSFTVLVGPSGCGKEDQCQNDADGRTDTASDSLCTSCDRISPLAGTGHR